MKRYELVREIFNRCANNQMRDVFFAEVETDDPLAYVRQQCKGEGTFTRTDAPGEVTVDADIAGLLQRFTFTEI